MPFTARSDSELESALDALGFSAIAEIPVRINPRFIVPTDLLRQVGCLLDTPLPSVPGRLHDGTERFFDGKLEKQVIQQLRDMDQEKERRTELEDKEIAEYKEELKKKKEEEEKEKEKVKEKEKQEQEKKAVNAMPNGTTDDDKKADDGEGSPNPAEASSSNTDATNVEEKATDPPPDISDVQKDPAIQAGFSQLSVTSPVTCKAGTVPSGQRDLGHYPRQPVTTTIAAGFTPQLRPQFRQGGAAAPASSTSVGGQRARPTGPWIVPEHQTLGLPSTSKINFSEFEGESDPFESVSLKTINEKKELADVFNN